MTDYDKKQYILLSIETEIKRRIDAKIDPIYCLQRDIKVNDFKELKRLLIELENDNKIKRHPTANVGDAFTIKK